MMQALELENFKGVGGRQRVEFAPLTLLFGGNSAGKSTVHHSLLYLSELLERGDADVDRTLLGGSVLELGGFGRLVHKHGLRVDRFYWLGGQQFPTQKRASPEIMLSAVWGWTESARAVGE